MSPSQATLRYQQRRNARTAAKKANAHRAASPATIDRRQPSAAGVNARGQFAERTRPGTDGKVQSPALPDGVDVHAGAVAGVLADGNVPNLHANKVSDGVLGDGRIPNLSAGKITSGVMKMDTLKGITSNGDGDDAKLYSRHDTDAFLANKAGKTATENALATKAGKTATENALANKLEKTTFQGHGHGWSDLSGVPKSENQDVESLRRIGGTGQNKMVSASDHHHSISFKGLPREAKAALLNMREGVASGIRDGSYGEEGPARDLAGLVLALSVLSFDDPDRTAAEMMARFEREEDYEDHYLEHNIPGYVERRESGDLPRFFRETPPDISVAIGS